MALRTPLLAALALAACFPAHADGDRYTLSAAYVQECGACHTPYPPALLPNESWQRLMNNLPRHFGTDASLDAPTQKALSTWLAATAGGGKRARVAPPQDRITRGDWFIREHREVPQAAWSRPAIKSAANCGACHQGAAQGNYDEDSVHIPR